MTAASLITAVTGLAALGLLLDLLVRPQRLRERSGRLLALVAALVLPAMTLAGAVSINMRKSTEVEFCLSCHEMEPYGASMQLDDDEALPAVHYQNRLVSRETACYDCHTDYTMYGTVSAKLNGLKHVYKHYLGEVPERIELYQPYDSAICLNCHAGAKSFTGNRDHRRKPGLLDSIASGAKGCLDSGCHAVVHLIWDDEEEDGDDDDDEEGDDV